MSRMEFPHANVTSDDVRFMEATIRLARRNKGLTGTNPSVGTILVKDGIIVGRGVTAIGGRPHAEPQALADSGEAARGATAYVSLEPCAHHGRTPPCAEALVRAGVARVVVAATDPDDRVSGKGFAILRDAGIEVVPGVLSDKAADDLAGYLDRSSKTSGSDSETCTFCRWLYREKGEGRSRLPVRLRAPNRIFCARRPM